jgi:hypothetical protein
MVSNINEKEREKMFVIIGALLMIFGAGCIGWYLFDEIVGIGLIFVSGGFLIFLSKTLTIRFAELELNWKIEEVKE